MVNFRYHLVSLIAVFLALAVGVVLGAGPLQSAIANRGGEENGADVAQLKAQLESATDLGGQYEEFVLALSDEVLDGKATGTSVAVVLLPQAGEMEAEPVVRALETAGANVVGIVQLKQTWDDPSEATYRNTLATAVSTNLKARPADPGPDATLAQGLFEVLSDKGSGTDLIRQMLTDEKTPLVDSLSAEGQVPLQATAFVLVGPGNGQRSAVDEANGRDDASGSQSSEALVNAEAELSAGQRSAWIALAETFAAAPDGAVAVGQALDSSDFITVLRENGVQVNTVDQGGTAMAALNTVLALVSGSVGAYGNQMDAMTQIAPLSPADVQ